MKKFYNPGNGAAFRRGAKEVKQYRAVTRILSAMLSLLVLSTAIVYVVSILYAKFGSLTVSVGKFDANKYALTLSEHENFYTTVTRLNCKTAADVINISVNDLPGDLDTRYDGQHNGENYFAYTFYLKNAGDFTVTYSYSINIVDVKNNVDEAIRFRLYVNGEYTDYALAGKDGNPEDGTTKFVDKKTVCYSQISDFAPDDITKFTVVMWLEGDDPECLDPLIKGSIKANMIMSVVNAVE